jgi:histidinol dehydrogenase
MRLYRTQGRSARQTEAILTALEQRGGSSLEEVLPAVRKILRRVRDKGDQALLEYAKKFDGLANNCDTGSALRVSEEEMSAAWTQLDPALKQSLRTAASNIRAFARRQLPRSWSFSPVRGLTTGQLVRPIDSVGCYVPGGRHPLPSTMLMTVIPAQAAGVSRIVVCSPRPAAETLATAHLLGITEMYRIGGAHAVGALAYGTNSIARVSKIVGPGSLYVTAAKREVSSDPRRPCAIDMLAGPTEIVVTSDRGNATLIAADLVAQAEHDPAALAIFVTTMEVLANDVLGAVKEQSRTNPTAAQALKKNGYVFLASTAEEAQIITNRLAPEHLTIDTEADLAWVRNAGSVFIGDLAAQPLGDYISGPNHTLPTGGMATIRGGLSVLDYVKLITIQQYSAKAIATLGPQAIRLAEAEGLTGHAEAIRVRASGAAKETK